MSEMSEWVGGWMIGGGRVGDEKLRKGWGIRIDGDGWGYCMHFEARGIRSYDGGCISERLRSGWVDGWMGAGKAYGLLGVSRDICTGYVWKEGEGYGDLPAGYDNKFEPCAIWVWCSYEFEGWEYEIPSISQSGRRRHLLPPHAPNSLKALPTLLLPPPVNPLPLNTLPPLQKLTLRHKTRDITPRQHLQNLHPLLLRRNYQIDPLPPLLRLLSPFRLYLAIYKSLHIPTHHRRGPRAPADHPVHFEVAADGVHQRAIRDS